MLIFLEQNLTFLAVPKAGSTACEAALRPFASIDVRRPPHLRHMTARRYRRAWKPFLRRVWDQEPETFAVLRHPMARLESWYRYRRAGAGEKSTAEMSFDAFVCASLSDDPPDAARIGSQDQFAMDDDDTVLIDHLFAIEEVDPFLAFLEGRFETRIALDAKNTSAPADVSLSAETRQRLRDSREREFALYERVRAAGHLRSPRGDD